VLYLSPIFHIFEKRLKNLKVLVSIILFVDNSLFVLQEKSLVISNSHLFCSYNVMSFLLDQFSLVIEHGKTEIFHFSMAHGIFNLPPLDLSSLGGPILYPKETLCYLRFIFDRKLTLWQHINFYANKIISTVKCMNLLGNSLRSLIPNQKHLLYRIYVLSIALYGFPLWFFNKAPLVYPLKELRKMQHRAALYILEAFHIFSSFGIKAIAGLIPIHLHLQKLSGRLQLRTQLLPSNYVVKLFLEKRHSSISETYCLSLENITPNQQLKVKGSITDLNNKLNGIFSSFNSLDCKFSPGYKLIDMFSSCFSFHSSDWKSKDSRAVHIHKLDEYILQASANLKTAVVVSDVSIKNQVATFITHIHSFNNPIIKTHHHVINVTSTEIELFTIRYSINQAIQMANINCIVVIMDLLYVAQRIFDSFIHPYQIQLAII